MRLSKMSSETEANWVDTPNDLASFAGELGVFGVSLLVLGATGAVIALATDAKMTALWLSMAISALSLAVFSYYFVRSAWRSASQADDDQRLRITESLASAARRRAPLICFAGALLLALALTPIGDASAAAGAWMGAGLAFLGGVFSIRLIERRRGATLLVDTGRPWLRTRFFLLRSDRG
jgi:hypothetical protein